MISPVIASLAGLAYPLLPIIADAALAPGAVTWAGRAAAVAREARARAGTRRAPIKVFRRAAMFDVFS